MPYRRSLIAAATLLLVSAGAVAVTAADSTSGKPSRHQDYRDYMNGTGSGSGSGSSTGSGDQCDKPVAQRTGGWVCPATSAK